MSQPGSSRPKIVDEDGVPVVDATQTQPGFGPFPGAAGGQTPFGMPGFTVLDPTGRFMTADGSRPSLRKILGWRGIAVLIGVVALIVALAIVSIVAFAIVVPVLLLIGMITAGFARLRGRGTGPGSTVVRR